MVELFKSRKERKELSPGKIGMMTHLRHEGETVHWFEDGADMTITVDEIVGDGIPDNPGDSGWEKPVRTGQQDNLSTNIGLSATISFPLDGGLQERCKKTPDTNTALQGQLLANKRLDFEIARLKNCGDLLKQGIRFHPSPYAAICADVVVNNVNTIQPHRHTIPPTSSKVKEQTSTSSQPHSSDAALARRSALDCAGIFLPRKDATFFKTFFTTGFTTFNKRSARGFASRANVVAHNSNSNSSSYSSY